MVYVKNFFLGALAVGAVYFMILGVASTTSATNGIHVISENAVYIAGESCTINAGLDRENNLIMEEAQSCVELHSAYRTLRYYDKKNQNATEVVAEATGN